MHQNDLKDGELRLQTDLIDNHGVIKKNHEEIITRPESIRILDSKTKFFKVRDRLTNSLSAKDIGQFIRLTHQRVDYYTGLLRIGGKGISPKPIKTIKQISKILDIHRKTAESLINRLLKKNVILRINNLFYINPSFLQYGAYIQIDVFMEMIKKEPHILKHISKAQAKIISYFR